MRSSNRSIPELRARMTAGARIALRRAGCWTLRIPAGPAREYRVAQLDDYAALSRAAFRWRPPVGLLLEARASAADLPGTWGFGFWNDPASVQLGLGGTARRLPALPNAAWFFYASPPNHLTLRDDQAAHGLLAATFASPRLPWPLLLLGLPAIPLLAWSPTARLLRRAARSLVRESAVRLDLDPTVWHTYALAIEPGEVRFAVDGADRFSTPVTPRGPLGLVLWIDNQYMAFPPDGRLRFGTLANPEAMLELRDVEASVG